MNHVSGLMTPSAVNLDMRPASKDEWIVQLVDLLCRGFALQGRQEILDAVLEREQTHSTAIGHGVAVPHAKTPAVPSLVVACGVAREGVEFDAPDGNPVKIAFLMVSPSAETGPHVRALAGVSRAMLKPGALERILQMDSPRDLIRLIKHAENDH